MTVRNISVNLVLFLLCSFGFAGCKQDKTPEATQNYQIKSPENILSQYNANRPDWDWSQRTIGSIRFTISDTLILIEHNNLFSPEVVYYFLQIDEKVKNFKSSSIERAEVFYLDRHLLVNSLVSKATYIFSVKSAPVPDYLKGIEGAASYTGFGLGVKKVIIGAEKGIVSYCGCIQNGHSSTNCIATEFNAIECVTASEAGSCKVVCSGQYYACCDRQISQ